MPALKHLPIGTKLFDLTITQSPVKDRPLYSEAECQCGKKIIRRTRFLRAMQNKSCGCRNYRKGPEHPLWQGKGEISGDFWYMVGYQAKLRKIDFKITIDDAWDQFTRQERKCALTGLELTFRTQGKKFDGTASLDRIDPNKPYTPENIQWVHKDINAMRVDFSVDEFRKYCRLVTDYQNKT